VNLFFSAPRSSYFNPDEWAGQIVLGERFAAGDATVTGFANWITTPAFGLAPGDQGLTQDPDGDGNDNGVENDFGTNPGAFSQGLVSGTVSGNTFTFTHPLNATPATDLTASYQWSKGLSTFTAAGVVFEGSTVSFVRGTPSGGMVTVTGTALTKLFIAVKVTQN